MYTSAFPAVNHADWNKSAALLRNIDKLRDRIKALESAAGGTSANASANAASHSASDKV
jgi:UDP-3-O-[3-hydroxymyristoyl] glucosamine N-acyltransferase